MSFIPDMVVLHPLSTSNHNIGTSLSPVVRVVLHPLSTSNHNIGQAINYRQQVVLHPLSTSNHNYTGVETSPLPLYCILFLHQTTTSPIISVFRLRCIASSFYIKPQRLYSLHLQLGVVLHPLSTSNHNRIFPYSHHGSVVLHPLSTSNHNLGRQTL